MLHVRSYVPIEGKVGWQIYSYKVLARFIKRSSQTVIIWYCICMYVQVVTYIFAYQNFYYAGFTFNKSDTASIKQIQ